MIFVFNKKRTKKRLLNMKNCYSPYSSAAPFCSSKNWEAFSARNEKIVLETVPPSTVMLPASQINFHCYLVAWAYAVYASYTTA
jgi:hypothetical protein